MHVALDPLRLAQQFARDGMPLEKFAQPVAEFRLALRERNQALIEDHAHAHIAALERNPPAPPAVAHDVIGRRIARAEAAPRPRRKSSPPGRVHPNPSPRASAPRPRRSDAPYSAPASPPAGRAPPPRPSRPPPSGSGSSPCPRPSSHRPPVRHRGKAARRSLARAAAIPPAATARRSTSSSTTARSSCQEGSRTWYFGPISLESASVCVSSLANQKRIPCFTRCSLFKWFVSPSTRPRK